MYRETDSSREIEEENGSEFRSPYRRDFARLIHSPSFRRLQGKTQLYPGIESDFFRNRLTHSLEVAQIAKSIALAINHKFLAETPDHYINPDICEFAGLAHDLGHPPFGHQGEEALDEVMRDYGGFEGNAQTLRILSKIEKKVKRASMTAPSEYRFGLNLTYRSLASILKYDKEIPIQKVNRSSEDREKPIKGYYLSEKGLVSSIKSAIGNTDQSFKTIECRIMDIADDIAYSTYDLEDGFKAGFYHPVMFFSYPETVFVSVARKVSRAIGKDFTDKDVYEGLFRIFATIYNFEDFDFEEAEDEVGQRYVAINKEDAPAIFSNIVNMTSKASKLVSEDAYLRNEFTSELINSAIEGVRFTLNPSNPALSLVELEEETKIRVEILKSFTYESQILSPRLKVAEFRGKEIVKEIFLALSSVGGFVLLPSDYQRIFNHFSDESDRMRCICDFIAGMTDKYAIEFYGRLKSENPETIFKPF